MNKLSVFLVLAIIIVFSGIFLYLSLSGNNPSSPTAGTTQSLLPGSVSPLAIDVMRKTSYPGSDLTIEQTLTPGVNYKQYIASYISDGLKIYGLLTVPAGNRPPGGWPAVIFNHGYIPPKQYKTTEKYVAYVDGFAKSGFIVFKPDYRGFGNSEGVPESAYFGSAYTIDVLNAVSSIKKFKDANPNEIGMWGHSMGGYITLRSLVVSSDIKAAVIWSGVVGSYNDLINNWLSKIPANSPARAEIAGHVSERKALVDTYGTPGQNPNFWNSIDPTSHLDLITAPIQLHQGLADNEVPLTFSANLKDELSKLGKTVEYYTYKGADHNLSGPAFDLAMKRSIDFFDKYLKGGE